MSLPVGCTCFVALLLAIAALAERSQYRDLDFLGEASSGRPSGANVQPHHFVEEPIPEPEELTIDVGDGSAPTFINLVATRHAEAEHNVAEKLYKTKNKPMEEVNEVHKDLFIDASLTVQGFVQVYKEKVKYRTIFSSYQPKFVFVSSLRRTMQTAVTLLKVPMEDCSRAAGAEVNPFGFEAKIIPTDLLCEKRTGFYADTRSEAPLIDVVSPWGKFLLDASGQQAGLWDNDWYFGKSSEGQVGRLVELEGRKVLLPALTESDTDVTYRAAWFLKLLKQLTRWTDSVAIVSHKGFLRQLEIAGGKYDQVHACGEARKLPNDEEVNVILPPMQARVGNMSESMSECVKELKKFGIEYKNAETRVYRVKILR